MSFRQLLARSIIAVSVSVGAYGAEPDVAAAFGARPDVSDLRMSPDGASVAFLVPLKGQGSALHTMSLAAGAKSRVALVSDGKPDRLVDCSWVSNTRLVCAVSAGVKDPEVGILPFTRLVAVNADGSNLQLLSKRENAHTRGMALGGGSVIDWLPDEEGAVLMQRNYLPDDHLGSHIASTAKGLGVDRVDTNTLADKHIEMPREEAVEYISDHRGTVRIVGLLERNSMQQNTGVLRYMYRLQGSRDWHKLGDFNYADGIGFNPIAVDADLNLVYGLKKKDGRWALYSVTLTDPPDEELVYARPDVDLDDLFTIGRRHRVVGVTYVTDATQTHFFDPAIERLLTSLSKALPQQPLLTVTDASVDESKLLIFAGSDSDPGVYYIFDRKTHQLQTFLVERAALEGMKLASVKAITYPAADGTPIPAYLTLPPGVTEAKGLPAIVLPHGGPGARDEWGFDWLSQFYAARGFVVLQPNFRGSSGYGDAWFEKNGFRSWKIAIGDVRDAGHWLVKEGIADPGKLGIVGWSYGGYAALQSAVTEPGLFKAVVAIAPVTDLAALKKESLNWSNHDLSEQFIGDGPHIREGSPAEHADQIKVPVLLFHAELDRNVSIEESRLMAARLKAAGGSVELVTWDNLDHQLDDSAARTQLLSKSDAFLKQAFSK